MGRVSIRNTEALSGKMVYIGIDVHKEKWQTTVRTDGEEIFNGHIPGDYGPAGASIQKHTVMN